MHVWVWCGRYECMCGCGVGGMSACVSGVGGMSACVSVV